MKYDAMASQMFSPHKFCGKEIMFGLERMIIGYWKKCVIADQLGLFVQAIYHGDTTYYGSYLVIAIVAYAFQLYADFSGCMDIVLGASQTFGIYLPENFQSPFFSATLSEFWRRWHITLGLWFKDYLFYPILKCNFMQKIGKISKKTFGKRRGKKKREKDTYLFRAYLYMDGNRVMAWRNCYVFSCLWYYPWNLPDWQ